MAIEAYLNFNGSCREAVEFYSKVFQTPIQPIMTFGDGEPSEEFPVPEDARHLVMHTFLMIAGDRVMFSDTFPDDPVTMGENINLTIVTEDLDQIRTQFEALREGADVQMELQETFWSKLYGMLIDKFGVAWQFSHEDPSARQPGE